MSKTFLFQAIQFSQTGISTQFSSISPIDRTLSGATTIGQSGLWSNGNKGVLRIPQSSCITGAFIIMSCYQHGYFWPSLSPPLPIVHCFWQILRATSSIGTEMLYVGLSWTSCLCSSMWRGPQEYIMSLSLLLQQRPACLVHLILIVFMTGGRWLYSRCFVRCCLQD